MRLVAIAAIISSSFIIFACGEPGSAMTPVSADGNFDVSQRFFCWEWDIVLEKRVMDG